MKKTFLITLIILSVSFAQKASAVSITKEEFIRDMAKKYDFDVSRLNGLFAQATVSKSILEAISRPAEKKLPWYKYKNIFLQEKRIQQGIEFWQKHSATLQRAEEKFGVPAEIIVAIIGVETFYGRITGSYRVFDALNTLAFHYPKRADFFRSEFEQFLLLTREQGFDPLSLTGSYAGAMGMPQFISSSYRHYAIDFDNDNVINIWDNPVDAIGSVANYFVEHDWQQGQPVINRVNVSGSAYKQALTKGLKPDLAPSSLNSLGIRSPVKYSKNEKLKLLEYELEDGSEFWLARKNFYVITRYNHSELYAMAVYQLANEIKERKRRLALNTE